LKLVPPDDMRRSRRQPALLGEREQPRERGLRDDHEVDALAGVPGAVVARSAGT
jgi:hypothetical protein